ncbi:MAG: HAD-IIB family hydrolase [Myxococcota bacterium]
MTIPRYLLMSDLDGTLIPLEETAQRLHEVGEFAGLVQASPGLLLAYVTGRDFALAQTGIREFGLPTPHFMACDVGTSLYRLDGDEFRLDEGYRASMRAALGDHTGPEVRDALSSIGGIEPQEDAKQGEFKVSYYTSGRPDAVVDRVHGCLDAQGVTANVVASFDSVSQRGLLDILPRGVAKDRAVRYLHEQSAIDDDHMVYAGDSGNDRAAMLTGCRSIVVANADRSFQEALQKEASDRGISDRLYFAGHPYARGVVEGCRYFGVFPAQSSPPPNDHA